MSEPRQTDDIYYAHGTHVPLARRVLLYARSRKFEHFTKVIAPDADAKILDFGVSETMTEESNFIERLYAHPENITCVGIGTGEEVTRHFPKVAYRTIIAGERLPFADGTFDIACSNAVFERLGNDQARAKALSELLRVAKRVYITVPNGLFPVEHHTGIPLLHYLPTLFRRVLKGSKLDYWTHPENMDFLNKSRIHAFLPNGIRFHVAFCGLKLGPFSSNIALWSE